MVQALCRVGKGVNMNRVIEVHPFNACLTITFLNRSFENPTPTVWVCENKTTYDRALARLQILGHIEIVQNGASHVEMEAA